MTLHSGLRLNLSRNMLDPRQRTLRFQKVLQLQMKNPILLLTTLNYFFKNNFRIRNLRTEDSDILSHI